MQLLPGHVKETSPLISATNISYCSPYEITTKGNNWVGVFDFLPSEGNREKSKTPTWSDDEGGAEHIKNSCTMGRTSNVIKNYTIYLNSIMFGLP